MRHLKQLVLVVHRLDHFFEHEVAIFLFLSLLHPLNSQRYFLFLFEVH